MKKHGVKYTHFVEIMDMEKDKTTWPRAGATCLGTKLYLLCHFLCSDINCCGHTTKYIILASKSLLME